MGLKPYTIEPLITYESLVLWPKMKQGNAVNMLDWVQKFAYLGIAGSVTQAKAVETLLNYPPLYLLIMRAPRMVQIRRENSKKSKSSGKLEFSEYIGEQRETQIIWRLNIHLTQTSPPKLHRSDMNNWN